MNTLYLANLHIQGLTRPEFNARAKEKKKEKVFSKGFSYILHASDRALIPIQCSGLFPEHDDKAPTP